MSTYQIATFYPIRYLLIFCFSFFLATTANAQGFYTTFGKNRVQYNDFIWSFYESDNFVTYTYQGGKEIGKFCIMVAEQSLEDIEAKLEFKNNNKVEIMVYHNISDLNQTNIGLGIATNNTGGITKIIGNKIFVYFNGNHQHLARQIQEGVAKVSLERMIFGSNIQEILQNAVLLNLPDWFVNGLVSYIGKEWSTDMDNKLKYAIERKEFENFNKLTGQDATFAGHALWNYITLLHGETAIPNLLYLTRINRSIESGFHFVLGSTLKKTIEEFNTYYKDLYQEHTISQIVPDNDNLVLQTSKRKQRRQVLFKEVKISPNGEYIAYTTNEKGQQRVFLYNTLTNKQEVILRNGSPSFTQALDYTYPLVAWSKKGTKIAIVYEKRDEMKLMVYDMTKPKKQERKTINDITKFQQVIDIAFTNDSRKLVLSGVQRGQADLFLYQISNTKTKRLTNDFYADLSPTYIKTKDQEGILFLSNRTNDTLRKEKIDSIAPLANYDVFFYDLKTGVNEKNKVLVRVTNTPLANESFPTQYDSTHVAFLSDENGINNLYIAKFDSFYLKTDKKVLFQDSVVMNPTYSLTTFEQQGLVDTIINIDTYKITAKRYPITNYAKSIVESDIALKNGEAVYLMNNNGRYKFYQESLLERGKAKQLKLKKTPYRERLEKLYQTEQTNIARKKEVEAAKRKLLKQNEIKNASLPDTLTIPKPIKEDTVPKNSAVKTTPNPEEIDIENYFFQSEFEEEAIAATEKKATNTTEYTQPDTKKKAKEDTKKTSFKRTKTRPYQVQFSIDQVVTQLDNTLLFTNYESFNLTGVGFNPPDLNGFIKVGITDLFEDYRVIGGFRFPLDLRGSEYFVEYQALKKRLDKKFLGYRKSENNRYTLNIDPDTAIPVDAKNITNYVQFSLIWPFDVNTSLQGHLGYRSDRINFLATDVISLIVPSQQENWFFGKVEYIFDNTIDVALNILNGTRYKAYIEIHKPFDGTITDQEFSLKFKDTGLLGIIGGDFRHYQRVHRQITWANRASTAISFGSKKMIYYLGGVENWLQYDNSKRFNNDTPIDQTQNYAFQSLATNLRGFRQNIRNGSSYFALNSELRVPIFSYLSSNPIRSEFLRNFQIIGFGDIGTAWQGLSPFNEENQFTIVTIGQEPVTATVKYFRNPIVGGYGYGLRSKLLGYFVRIDRAWGIDSGARTDPRWYVSMGLDF